MLPPSKHYNTKFCSEKAKKRVHSFINKLRGVLEEHETNSTTGLRQPLSYVARECHWIIQDLCFLIYKVCGKQPCTSKQSFRILLVREGWRRGDSTHKGESKQRGLFNLSMKTVPVPMLFYIWRTYRRVGLEKKSSTAKKGKIANKTNSITPFILMCSPKLIQFPLLLLL